MTPISLTSLPNAVGSAAARGMREGIRREIVRLTPVISLAGGLTTVLVTRRVLNRMEDRRRLRRIERKLDKLARSVDGTSPP